MLKWASGYVKDNEWFVQKAIGWWLRVLGEHNEPRVRTFLKQHPEIKAKLEERKQSDTGFAKSPRAQLNFVYQNSPYFEPDYLRYPVCRVLR